MHPYLKYNNHLRKLADINYTSAVLQWDQEVNMPEAGAELRAQQLATLAGIAHDLGISEELGKLLIEMEQDESLDDKQRRNVRESLRNYRDRKKYTTEFVMEMSRTVSESFQLWQQARTKNDFSLFAPALQKIVDLKLKECELLGYTEHPYDALLNQYEPGLTTRRVRTLFEDVRAQLVPFVKEVIDAGSVDTEFLRLQYDKKTQWEYGLQLLKQMGYDFSAGRQDLSTHPFTTNFNSRDVRVTTRINENDLSEMIWSCIHEGGHALYEQGLPYEDYGLPSGEYMSLGIHESQSRLWENNVGRSLIYWKYNYPDLQNLFPQQLGNISLEHFYKAINQVQPSLIRTSADELTYHLHILIRFEIETGLMEKKYKVEDLPEIWNSKYSEYLGLKVPDASHGVLQDVHWSHGSFGYFPTYSLGSFYAAQFYRQAQTEVEALDQSISEGNTAPLLAWLREKIHRHGRIFHSEELCEMITGRKLDFNAFMEYARNKYGRMPGIISRPEYVRSETGE